MPPRRRKKGEARPAIRPLAFDGPTEKHSPGFFRKEAEDCHLEMVKRIVLFIRPGGMGLKRGKIPRFMLRAVYPKMTGLDDNPSLEDNGDRTLLSSGRDYLTKEEVIKEVTDFLNWVEENLQ